MTVTMSFQLSALIYFGHGHNILNGHYETSVLRWKPVLHKNIRSPAALNKLYAGLYRQLRDSWNVSFFTSSSNPLTYGQ